jgi:hypothetical protein
MRRLAISVCTVVGLALLSACSGGTGFGNGTGSSKLTSVVFSTGSSGEVSDFFLAPGAISPLQISATGENGTGPSAEIVYGQSFIWTARFVNPKTDPPSIATYTTGTVPSTFKACPSPPAVQPAVPILIPGTVAGVSSGYVGYTPLPASQAASTVYVGSVPGAAAPYCLVLTAIHQSDGVSGTVTVVVSNSP